MPRFQHLQDIALKEAIALVHDQPVPLLVSVQGAHIPVAHIAAGVQLLPILQRTKVKTGGINPMAHFIHLRQHPVRHTEVRGRMGKISVQRLTISVGHNGGIIGTFGATLDLKRVHSCSHQFRDMLDHTQILGIENIRAVLLLIDGEILTRAGLLHQVVLPAAGLGTVTTVGVSPHHIIRENAPTAKAHTHGTVNKGLNLQLWRRMVPDHLDLVQ